MIEYEMSVYCCALVLATHSSTFLYRRVYPNTCVAYVCMHHLIMVPYSTYIICEFCNWAHSSCTGLQNYNMEVVVAVYLYNINVLADIMKLRIFLPSVMEQFTNFAP